MFASSYSLSYSLCRIPCHTHAELGMAYPCEEFPKIKSFPFVKTVGENSTTARRHFGFGNKCTQSCVSIVQTINQATNTKIAKKKIVSKQCFSLISLRNFRAHLSLRLS